MKRIIPTTVAVILATVSLFATSVGEDYRYNYLTLTMKSGSETSYSLKGFRVTYDAENMYIESAGEKYTVATVSIDKMNFTETPTSILQLHAKNAVEIREGSIIVTNFGSKKPLRVYSTDGATVYAVSIAAGDTETDLSFLPKGIYIIKTDGQTIKFEKK